MAVFDIFKRLVSQNTVSGERRVDERVRATLGARVLVVDDSATIRAVLGKMLMQDGYQVLKAADGENAVEMAHAQLPDLIFLDIVLPGMSGFAVLRALRRDAATRTTPIIMMSGNQQATEQFYVQRFGADGFIKKPFGRAEVFHAVRSLVQAERLPARVETVPVDTIPEGVSPEEWNAIPDVAMPDEAHLDAGTIAVEPQSPAALPESVAAAKAAPAPPVAATPLAISAAVRPTLAPEVRPTVTVNVAAPQPAVAGPADMPGGTPEAKPRDDET